MTVHALIPLLATIVYIILFLVVLFNRPWQRQHKLFSLYLLAATVWALSEFFLLSTFLTDYKIHLFRAVICSGIWWALQLFVFIRSYLNMIGGLGVWIGVGGLALFIILAILDYAPPRIIIEDDLFVGPEYGWWFLVYIIPMVVMAVMAEYSLVKKLKVNSDPVQKNRISYLIVAVGILIIFGCWNSTFSIVY